jgi:predicted phage terminase large subunit-like protein
LAREASSWRIISLAMLAGASDPIGRQAGERLWPEWFTEEMIDNARKDTRSWNALYQQDPVPEEGDYFKRDNFSQYSEIPGNLRIYGASDFAVSEGQGDFTEHGIFGVDTQMNVFVLDWWRGQTQSDVWIEKMCDLIQQWKPLVWFGEAGPIRRAIEPFLMKRMSDRSAFCRIEWMASINDKVVRARAIQALASIKGIFWPKVSTWRAEVEKQLLQFPAGKYDDAVDVFSLIGRGLEHVNTPRTVRQRLVEPRAWSA